MRDAVSSSGELLPDAQLNPFGPYCAQRVWMSFLRLINVLVGQMSLVGPRPLLPEYLDRYTSEQARRHEVKPGITGWAQVNGRNSLTWEKRFRLDVWYVDNWSILLDLKILLMTIITVIRREGISSEGHATMAEFRGSAHGN